MAAREAEVYAMVVGRVIAQLRERRGLTQGQLAQTAGIAHATMSRIEAGHSLPDAFVLRRIAEGLGMTTGDLNATFDRAYARTQQAAASAAPAKSSEQPWWAVALTIAGVVGLAGLVGFAVAAALAEEDDE